jgi:hypothetical protein
MAETTICEIPGCGNAVLRTKLCRAHYLRKCRHGSPYGGGPSITSKLVVDDFIKKALSASPDECLSWPFNIDLAGYPKIKRKRKTQHAHRHIFELKGGPPPDESLQAAHNCGNRTCCNPWHIRWATAKENQADREIHGTRIHGEDCNLSRLTNESVSIIKRRIIEGRRQYLIAKEFGVSKGVINNIKKGRTWARILPAEA